MALIATQNLSLLIMPNKVFSLLISIYCCCFFSLPVFVPFFLYSNINFIGLQGLVRICESESLGLKNKTMLLCFAYMFFDFMLDLYLFYGFFGYRKLRLWIEERNVEEKKKAKEKLIANREKEAAYQWINPIDHQRQLFYQMQFG